MTHPRKLIRHYFVDQLKVEIGTVNGRVFASRAYPLQREELPGICVYSTPETSEQRNLKGALDRDVKVFVEIHYRDVDNPDDYLDDLAEEIEAVFDGDINLGGLSANCWLEETEIDYQTGGEQVNGVARLRYNVRYFTSPG